MTCWLYFKFFYFRKLIDNCEGSPNSFLAQVLLCRYHSTWRTGCNTWPGSRGRARTLVWRLGYRMSFPLGMVRECDGSLPLLCSKTVCPTSLFHLSPFSCQEPWFVWVPVRGQDGNLSVRTLNEQLSQKDSFLPLLNIERPTNPSSLFFNVSQSESLWRDIHR